MFPIRDHNPSGSTPYVTYALIAANVAIFLSYWGGLDGDVAAARFLDSWAMFPRRISQGHDLVTILTAMFLHGGWMHLLGNMLFLWIFGDNLEDVFGHLRFLGFYLLSGFCAAFLQIAGDPMSDVPMIGASGAIAGVMGGYMLLFPRARVDVLVILVVFFRVFAIPAWIVLSIWFGLQLLSSLAAGSEADGVAYLAHVGGFVGGLAMTFPRWLRLGGPAFWRLNRGLPPHPEQTYALSASRIPVVRRRR